MVGHVNIVMWLDIDEYLSVLVLYIQLHTCNYMLGHHAAKNLLSSYSAYNPYIFRRSLCIAMQGRTHQSVRRVTNRFSAA